MNFIEALRWLLAAPIGLIGVWVTLCNCAGLVLWLARRSHHSLVPILGGVCLAMSWLVCPAAGRKAWAWVPLALDPGCWTCLLAFTYYQFVRAPRTQ